MNADLTTLLTIGVLAVLGAATVLALLVRGDLAPRAGSGVLANDSGRAGPRDDGGRWFIVAGLGMGIFAFSLKLAVIVALQHFPQQTIGRLKNAAVARVAEKVEPETLATVAEPVRSFYVWATLPAMVPAPADNPTTPAKIALGEILFNDTALSLDHTISCASCHDITGAAGADRGPETTLRTGPSTRPQRLVRPPGGNVRTGRPRDRPHRPRPGWRQEWPLWPGHPSPS